jgi:hypothetical protein
MHKYFILLFIPSILLIGCDNNATGPGAANYLQSFEKVWNDYDRNYSYFIAKNINWDSIRTVYEPLVQNEITYDYFTKNVLKGMLTELHDLHVSLKDKKGNQIPLYSRPPEINFHYDDAFYNRYLTNIVNTSNGMFKMAAINDSIGYILINGWSSQEDVNEFEHFFTIIKVSMRSTKDSSLTFDPMAEAMNYWLVMLQVGFQQAPIFMSIATRETDHVMMTSRICSPQVFRLTAAGNIPNLSSY